MRLDLVKQFVGNVLRSNNTDVDVKQIISTVALNLCNKPHDRILQKRLHDLMTQYNLNKYWPVVNTPSAIIETSLSYIETTLPAWAILAKLNQTVCYHATDVRKEYTQDADGKTIIQDIIKTCNFIAIGNHGRQSTCIPMNSYKSMQAIQSGIFGSMPSIFVEYKDDMRLIKHLAIRVYEGSSNNQTLTFVVLDNGDEYIID